jgi:hypothetical protein
MAVARDASSGRTVMTIADMIRMSQERTRQIQKELGVEPLKLKLD